MKLIIYTRLYVRLNYFIVRKQCIDNYVGQSFVFSFDSWIPDIYMIPFYQKEALFLNVTLELQNSTSFFSHYLF